MTFLQLPFTLHASALGILPFISFLGVLTIASVTSRQDVICYSHFKDEETEVQGLTFPWNAPTCFWEPKQC